MALASTQPQAVQPNHPAVLLCAFVLLAVLVGLGFGMASATNAGGQAAESAVKMENDPVTFADTHHNDDGCGHNHESVGCSPCPTCSAGLPSATGPETDIPPVTGTLVLQPHHDGVVPRGIRRPPRPS